MRTTEEAVEIFKAKYGDRFDYTQYEYEGQHVHSTIGCPDHGEFQATFHTHRRSHGGCAECRIDDRRNKFIEKVRSVYGEDIDFSAMVYVDNQTPVTLSCIHGEFSVYPCNVKKGAKCRKCLGNIRRQRTGLTIVPRFEALHGDRFDYSKVVYSDMHKKVLIVCRDHGVFEMSPANHLSGHYCWKCSCNASSREEDNWIGAIEQMLGVAANKNMVVTGQKGASSKVDAVVGNVAIEYDGAYWHSLDGALVKDERKTSIILEEGLSVIRLRAYSASEDRLPDVPGAVNIHVPEQVDEEVVDEVCKTILALEA